MVCVANLLPKTLADFRVQILTTIGALPPFWQCVVREEAHSFSVTPVSCVTKRVKDIMPALQAYHARERELQCIATEVMQEPGSSSDLLMVQDCTEQYAHAISDDKHRALLADLPQYFALIFRSLRFHLLACCELGRRSRMMSLPQVSLCSRFSLSQLLSTSQDYPNLVLPVHS